MPRIELTRAAMERIKSTHHSRKTVYLDADIRKAIEQGYSLKDIKNILAEAGISVSIASMQSILEGKSQASQDESDVLTKRNTPDNTGAPISKI